MTCQESAVKSLLQKLASSSAATRKRLSESGEAFSPFRENLIYMGETGISAILAMLFSPAKSHFQGTRFLQALMAHLPCGQTNAVAEEIRISTERYTREDDSRRFVDITVEAPDIVLGIENKVWAADQPSQVADYLRWLRHMSNGRKYFLVYISPFGHAPSEISLSEEAARQFEGHYSCLSWNAVAEILEKAATVTPPRIRIFVEDFCRALRQITGTTDLRMTEMDNSLIKTLSEDATAEELLAAEAIWHNYQKTALAIANQWTLRLENALRERGIKGTIKRFTLPNHDAVYCQTSFLFVEYEQEKLAVGIYADECARGPLMWALWTNWEYFKCDAAKCAAYPPIAAMLKKYNKTVFINGNEIINHSCDMNIENAHLLNKMRQPDPVFLLDEICGLCNGVENWE